MDVGGKLNFVGKELILHRHTTQCHATDACTPARESTNSLGCLSSTIGQVADTRRITHV